MIIDYLNEFPIPAEHLPQRLRDLLEPVGNDPQLTVEVASHFENDRHGPGRECFHMVTALVPRSSKTPPLYHREASSGLVAFSTPIADRKGDLKTFKPSIAGLDYIVAAWGDGSHFTYHLAEKVWMALGLSARCLGGEEQRMVYDDLSLPEFGVAEGEISSEYYGSSKRNVHWTMSNEFLRRYLWMRGCYGARVFFYEARLPDAAHLRALMDDQPHVRLAPEGGWYALDIREQDGTLLIQVWGTVAAIPPELCPELSANNLRWPGVEEPMTHDKANALIHTLPVYLDDRFLERYEQSSFFDTTPVGGYRWNCSPSYRGQWSFTECTRIGRNMIMVPMRELYKPKPDREILHAHAYAMTPAQIANLASEEEHIVAKTDRFLKQILILGDRLSALGDRVGVPKPTSEIVGFDRGILAADGWLEYPQLERLAQVAPLAMSQQAFISRCKSLHEIWQKIPDGFIRSLVQKAGHRQVDIRELRSLKLLQTLSNILERLNAQEEKVDAFSAGAEPSDISTRNAALAALFINNDLRIADAHDAGGTLRSLEQLGFDIASTNQGYGRALDFVFDRVIGAFAHLARQLDLLIRR